VIRESAGGGPSCTFPLYCLRCFDDEKRVSQYLPWIRRATALDRCFGLDEIVRDGKSLSDAGGVDIILSTSNSTKSMMDSIQGLRPDGRFIVMGADAEPLSISLVELLFKRIKIIRSQQNGPEYLYEALDYVDQGKVKSIVETYPLAEAAKAYERVAEGKARFRAILTM
jgi:dehydrogenase